MTALSHKARDTGFDVTKVPVALIATEIAQRMRRFEQTRVDQAPIVRFPVARPGAGWAPLPAGVPACEALPAVAAAQASAGAAVPVEPPLVSERIVTADHRRHSLALPSLLVLGMLMVGGVLASTHLRLGTTTGEAGAPLALVLPEPEVLPESAIVVAPVAPPIAQEVAPVASGSADLSADLKADRVAFTPSEPPVLPIITAVFAPEIPPQLPPPAGQMAQPESVSVPAGTSVSDLLAELPAPIAALPPVSVPPEVIVDRADDRARVVSTAPVPTELAPPAADRAQSQTIASSSSETDTTAASDATDDTATSDDVADTAPDTTADTATSAGSDTLKNAGKTAAGAPSGSGKAKNNGPSSNGGKGKSGKGADKGKDGGKGGGKKGKG